jgi:hypothetical protein
MSGYTLIEGTQLAAIEPQGRSPDVEVYGILDFLRELSDETLPFSKYARLRVMGLEEVLFAARPHDREIAAHIHQRLQRAASGLEKKLLSVQVVFQGDLRRGDKLWSDYRGARLPVDVIFDSPLPETDSRGNRFYRVHFNLTSPSP